MDELYTNSTEFLRAVMALRAMAPQYRSLAHHAADFWSNDELVERALRADVPAADLPVQGVLQ
jgi:hypothetical protein